MLQEFADHLEEASDEEIENDFALLHLSYRMDGGEDVSDEYRESVETHRQSYATLRHAFEKAIGLK